MKIVSLLGLTDPVLQAAVWKEAFRKLEQNRDRWHEQRRFMAVVKEANKVVREYRSPTSVQDKYRYC